MESRTPDSFSPTSSFLFQLSEKSLFLNPLFWFGGRSLPSLFLIVSLSSHSAHWRVFGVLLSVFFPLCSHDLFVRQQYRILKSGVLHYIHGHLPLPSPCYPPFLLLHSLCVSPGRRNITALLSTGNLCYSRSHDVFPTSDMVHEFIEYMSGISKISFSYSIFQFVSL